MCFGVFRDICRVFEGVVECLRLLWRCFEGGVCVYFGVFEGVVECLRGVLVVF